MQPTSSDITVAVRRNWVLEQYLQMKQPYQIKQEYQTLYPSVSLHSFDKDVKWMYEVLDTIEPTDVIKQHIGIYRTIANKCIEAGDTYNLLKCMKQTEDLIGLHNKVAGTNVQINNTHLDINTDMSTDQIKQLLGMNDGTTVPPTIDITPE